MSDILVYYTIDNKAEAEPCPITLTKPNNTLGDLIQTAHLSSIF